MNRKDFTLVASDEYPLGASFFEGSASGKRHLLVIASATGVPQAYYGKFAAFMADSGCFDAITFDYRGIGKSLTGHVKDSRALMSDWGRYDIQAALAWGFERYEKVFLVGHSVAGQVFPVADLSVKVSAAYFVGSQCAASHLWDGRHKLFVNFFWLVANPLPTKILGYMPAFVVGGGEHLPKKAALEWRSWGLHPDGILQSGQARASYARLELPVHFVNLADDRMLAPARAVQRLKAQYVNAQTSYEQLVPAQLGLKAIGHFGFFKSRYREKLWQLPLDYFRHRL